MNEHDDHVFNRRRYQNTRYVGTYCNHCHISYSEWRKRREKNGDKPYTCRDYKPHLSPLTGR